MRPLGIFLITSQRWCTVTYSSLEKRLPLSLYRSLIHFQDLDPHQFYLFCWRKSISKPRLNSQPSCFATCHNKVIHVLLFYGGYLLCLLFFLWQHLEYGVLDTINARGTPFNLLHCSHIPIHPFLFMKVCYDRKLSASVTGSHKICIPTVDRKNIYNACFLILKRKERRHILSLIGMILQWWLKVLSNDLAQMISAIQKINRFMPPNFLRRLSLWELWK